MARTGEQLNVPAKTVTELTNANVSGKISFMHISGGPATILGTTNATAPSVADFDSGWPYRWRDGQRGVTMDDLYPGLSYVRLWAYAPTGAVFSVYHG